MITKFNLIARGCTTHPILNVILLKNQFLKTFSPFQIPALGRKVLILERGKYFGKEAKLIKLHVEDFCADLEMSDGSMKTLAYEKFSKKYEK